MIKLEQSRDGPHLQTWAFLGIARSRPFIASWQSRRVCGSQERFQTCVLRGRTLLKLYFQSLNGLFKNEPCVFNKFFHKLVQLLHLLLPSQNPVHVLFQRSHYLWPVRRACGCRRLAARQSVSQSYTLPGAAASLYAYSGSKKLGSAPCWLGAPAPGWLGALAPADRGNWLNNSSIVGDVNSGAVCAVYPLELWEICPDIVVGRGCAEGGCCKKAISYSCVDLSSCRCAACLCLPGRPFRLSTVPHRF